MGIHVRDAFVRAAVSVLSRNYDITNRHVFSTEDGYKAQFRHLIRQRQRARMSGDLAEARRLRNLVNRAAPQLRQQFYQSKIDSMEESSTRDWWKHIKRLMGTSCEGNIEMQGLTNKHTEGDMAVWLIPQTSSLCQ